jgi:hypothetical protein
VSLSHLVLVPLWQSKELPCHALLIGFSGASEDHSWQRWVMNWLWNIGLDPKRRRRSIPLIEETTGGGCWNRTPRELSSTPPIRIHLRLTQNHNKKFRHLLHSSFACLIPANVQSSCMVFLVVFTVERKTERRRVEETAIGEATDHNYYYERKTNTHKPTHKGQHCNKNLINKSTAEKETTLLVFGGCCKKQQQQPTTHNCKHPFAVSKSNNSNTQPLFFANLQNLKPQTLIDERLYLVFFLLVH